MRDKVILQLLKMIVFFQYMRSILFATSCWKSGKCMKFFTGGIELLVLGLV